MQNINLPSDKKLSKLRWQVPAWMNRHTHMPHEHKREIARRAARNA